MFLVVFEVQGGQNRDQHLQIHPWDTLKRVVSGRGANPGEVLVVVLVDLVVAFLVVVKVVAKPLLRLLTRKPPLKLFFEMSAF